MPALVVILTLLVVAVAAAILIPRFFTIEKVEIEPQRETVLPADPSDAEAEKPLIDLDDAPLKEKMGLGGSPDGDEDGDPGDSGTEASAGKPEDPLEEELLEDRFSDVDRLTNFKSGRAFLVESQKALNQAKMQDLTYAAAYFDFDRFRFINSLKGLITGDYVLTRTSQDLENIFPIGSVITRVSADHFAVVFPVPDGEIYARIDEALKTLCEKIRSDMAIKGALRIRMGIAFTDLDMDYDVRVLLHKANLARYCIKTSRDETFRLFDVTMLSTYLFGESALEDYSENQYDEEFVLYYTPIEDLSRHAITGCEALARWVCEDEIDKTLPSAVNKYMLPSNNSKVIYQVCKAMSRWRKAGKQPLPVCVYIPPTELFKADLDEYLAKVLSEFQLEPSYLNIVIDAAVTRLDWSTVSRQIKRIADIGVKVGVDEVDAGYTNLGFLSELSLQFIKLHRSFMRGLLGDENGSEGRLVNMIELAKPHNWLVYLEGVDTKEQAELVGGLGVRMIQGAFAGKPQKADDFSQGLEPYVERKLSKDTVILDHAALSQGDYKVF